MVKVKKNIRRRHANKVRFKLKNRSRYKKVSLCREVTATGDKEGWVSCAERRAAAAAPRSTTAPPSAAARPL